jgi:hypothetical protein
MNTDKPFDLFLYYSQKSAQPAIKDLCKKLKAKYGHSISICVDYEQWLQNPGLRKCAVLTQGLKGSECILCCDTSGYFESTECQVELSYALAVHKRDNDPHARSSRWSGGRGAEVQEHSLSQQ